MKSSTSKKREIVQRGIKAHYQYYTDDGSGFMGSTKDSCDRVISVYPIGDSNLQSHIKFIKLTHRGLLPCILVNETRKEIIYPGPITSTFDQWVDQLMLKNIIPIMVAYFPSKKQTTYVPDEYRLAIRSLIKVVCFFHKENLCTEGFGRDNVCFQDSGLRLKGIQLTTASDDGIKKDYQCISAILEYLFLKAEETATAGEPKPLPHDMDDLAKLLFHGDKSKGELIATHVAILTHAERCIFIRNCSEKESVIDDGNMQVAYRKALTDLGDQYKWTKRIDIDHGPLHEAFNYEGSNYVDNNSHGKYDPPKIIKRTNNSMITYWRNLVVHIKDLSNRERYGYKYFKDFETDFMIMHVFGDLIVKFQAKLYDRNILPMFMILQEEP